MLLLKFLKKIVMRKAEMSLIYQGSAININRKISKIHILTINIKYQLQLVI